MARPGAVNSLYLLMAGSLSVLAVLSAALYQMGRPAASVSKSQLVVYCAAGIQQPMQQIAKQYEAELGVPIQLQYGGSNTLLNQVEVSRVGDLFLAADSSYVDLAREKNLAAERLMVARIRPVIAVREGDTRIRSLADLTAPGMRIAVPSPDAAAVGKTVRELLQKSGHWERLEQAVTQRGLFSATVNEVASAVAIGSVDAGIVWDCNIASFSKLEAVNIPELDDGMATIELTVLASSKNPTAALRFARYAAAADRGLQVFADMGYDVVDGDQWSVNPQITFFAGAVNRRALEPIVNEFQEREGATVNTIYNGCGILTAQMRTMGPNPQSGFPDTYMACDRYYLDVVEELFEGGVDISDTDIVIVVQKGNPKNIRSVSDLAGPGIKIAIGQPEQCTIGVLTRRLLQAEGIYDTLFEQGNVATQTQTSAMLVPSVTTRSVDATLAYVTDTLAEADKLEILRIDSPLAKAIQPFSVARSSPNKHLGRRLLEKISSSRDHFESAGFHWRLEPSVHVPSAGFGSTSVDGTADPADNSPAGG